MKVRDFRNSLPNRDQILMKIRAFKASLNKADLAFNLQNCADCGAQLKFAHASDYLRNVIIERSCCSTCGTAPSETKYSLN